MLIIQRRSASWLMSSDLGRHSEWRGMFKAEVAALSESYRPSDVDQDFVFFFMRSAEANSRRLDRTDSLSSLLWEPLLNNDKPRINVCALKEEEEEKTTPATRIMRANSLVTV